MTEYLNPFHITSYNVISMCQVVKVTIGCDLDIKKRLLFYLVWLNSSTLMFFKNTHLGLNMS